MCARGCSSGLFFTVPHCGLFFCRGLFSPSGGYFDSDTYVDRSRLEDFFFRLFSALFSRFNIFPLSSVHCGWEKVMISLFLREKIAFQFRFPFILARVSLSCLSIPCARLEFSLRHPFHNFGSELSDGRDLIPLLGPQIDSPRLPLLPLFSIRR